MNILSLFDGMSCGYEALTRAGIKIDNYFASEIDRYAIQISKKNHPDIIHIGSVTDIKYQILCDKEGNEYPEFDTKFGQKKCGYIDLLIGGSPCQDLSIAKKDGKGLAGEKSSLFFEYVRLLNETKPKYFLLENVASMRKADRDEITRILGVEPVMINSALVSAQNRKRLYWVGKWNGTKYETVDIPQPEDKNIVLRDILEDIPLDDPKWKPLEQKYIDKLKKYDWGYAENNSIGKIRQGYKYNTEESKISSLTVAHADNRRILVKAKSLSVQATYQKKNAGSSILKSRATMVFCNKNPSGHGINGNVYDTEGKSPTLTTNKGEGPKIIHESEYYWRKLTPTECERLQTLKDGYTEGVSNSQRYKMIGNGWTVDVIAHILSFLK